MKSNITYQERALNMKLVDTDSDGTLDFVDRSHGWHGGGLFDHDGKTIWRFDGVSGVDDVAYGDVDGDGRMEFAIAWNGGGGIQLRDRDGHDLWKQDDANVWHAEIVDTDNDGTPEIVHSNVSGALIIRDRRGNVLKQVRAPVYVSDFFLCPWPGRTDPPRILVVANGWLWVLKFDGTVEAKLALPDCPDHGEDAATHVRFKAAGPEYLAILLGYSLFDRSVIMVFDADHKLVYQEVLPDAGAAIQPATIDRLAVTKSCLWLGRIGSGSTPLAAK